MIKYEYDLIPQEQMERIRCAFQILANQIAESVKVITAEVAPIIRNIVEVMALQFAQPKDDLLRCYASPKEWRIYKHTKKRRIKKKYRDRFVRRWTEQS